MKRGLRSSIQHLVEGWELIKSSIGKANGPIICGYAFLMLGYFKISWPLSFGLFCCAGRKLHARHPGRKGPANARFGRSLM